MFVFFTFVTQLVKNHFSFATPNTSMLPTQSINIPSKETNVSNPSATAQDQATSNTCAKISVDSHVGYKSCSNTLATQVAKPFRLRAGLRNNTFRIFVGIVSFVVIFGSILIATFIAGIVQKSMHEGSVYGSISSSRSPLVTFAAT